MLNWYNTEVTVTLGDLIESGFNLFNFPYDYNRREFAWDIVPDGDGYKLHKTLLDKDFKAEFEEKVIEHFYTKQIGYETPGRFRRAFRARLREIMPTYNNTFRSLMLMDVQDDPMESYRLTEEYTHASNGSGEASTTTTDERSGSADKTHKFLDTPQGIISNVGDYLTEGSVDTDTTAENGTATSTGTNSNSSEETSRLTRYGNIGVQPLGDEILKYRDAFENVDQMIIADLECLFLQVY